MANRHDFEVVRHASDAGNKAHKISKSMTVTGASTSADPTAGAPVQLAIDAESQDRRKATASIDGADAMPKLQCTTY